MDQILDASFRNDGCEGLDLLDGPPSSVTALLGGPPSSATVHQPLLCAEIVRAGSWRPQR